MQQLCRNTPSRGDGIEVAVEEELDYEFTEEEAQRLAGDSQLSELSDLSDTEVVTTEKEVADGNQATTDEMLLSQNPGLRELFNRMLDEHIKQAATSTSQL